jgi:hypothetical protein
MVESVVEGCLEVRLKWSGQQLPCTSTAGGISLNTPSRTLPQPAVAQAVTKEYGTTEVTQRQGKVEH